mgnify:CR=1 FL=1
MLGYLSLDIICSSKLTVFLELRSRKTVRFSEQIMSADKYPSIFSCQMKAIVYLYSNNIISIVMSITSAHHICICTHFIFIHCWLHFTSNNIVFFFLHSVAFHFTLPIPADPAAKSIPSTIFRIMGTAMPHFARQG